MVEPDAAVIALARRFFDFDPPVWRYPPSPGATPPRNATSEMQHRRGGSARLSSVRLIETDALSWLQSAARPAVRHAPPMGDNHGPLTPDAGPLTPDP